MKLIRNPFIRAQTAKVEPTPLPVSSAAYPTAADPKVRLDALLSDLSTGIPSNVTAPGGLDLHIVDADKKMGGSTPKFNAAEVGADQGAKNKEGWRKEVKRFSAKLGNPAGIPRARAADNVMAAVGLPIVPLLDARIQLRGVDGKVSTQNVVGVPKFKGLKGSLNGVPAEQWTPAQQTMVLAQMPIIEWMLGNVDAGQWQFDVSRGKYQGALMTDVDSSFQAPKGRPDLDRHQRFAGGFISKLPLPAPRASSSLAESYVRGHVKSLDWGVAEAMVARAQSLSDAQLRDLLSPLKAEFDAGRKVGPYASFDELVQDVAQRRDELGQYLQTYRQDVEAERARGRSPAAVMEDLFLSYATKSVATPHTTRHRQGNQAKTLKSIGISTDQTGL